MRDAQKVKRWIVDNVASSTVRAAALGKFLVALANSFSGGGRQVGSAAAAREPSAARRRLHVLYILNDVLYHTVRRDRSRVFATAIEPMAAPLVRAAAAFKERPKHVRKLEDLVALWEEQGYFASETVEALHAAVRDGPLSTGEAHRGSSTAAANGSTAPSNTTTAAKNTVREAPYIMPGTHGDPSAASR